MEVAYTDRLLIDMRVAMERYRTENRLNGRIRTWSQVAYDILDGRVSRRELDDTLKAESESLRRFAADKQTPTRERLDRLRVFLTEEEYLSADDSQSEAHSKMEGFYTAFGFSAEQRLPIQDELCGVFVAQRFDSMRRIQIGVLSLFKSEGAIAVIEEQFSTTARPPYEGMPIDDLRKFLRRHTRAHIERRGWLAASPSGQIILLVVDPETQGPLCNTIVYNGMRQVAPIQNSLYILDYKAIVRDSRAMTIMDHTAEDFNVAKALVRTIVQELWVYSLCEKY